MNEPARRGLLRRRSATGEGTLSALGFVPGHDCWQAPAGAGPAARSRAVDVLDQALAEDVELTPCLRHPGIVPWVPAPEPSAPAREHVVAALTAVAATEGGKASFDVGTPARNVAWAFAGGAGDGGLTVGATEPETDTPYARDELDRAADAVLRQVTGAPLWISLIDVPERAPG